LKIRQNKTSVVALSFAAKKPAVGARLKKNTPLFGSLRRYFDKTRPEIRAPFKLRGTPFQKRVWRVLRGIPAGRTVSYEAGALRIGNKKSVRAVARAIGQNPAALLVPCHRVIGKNGSLTGYAYGLRKKAWLLAHERKHF
jgi:methylated-DNA-[protein]-cysteine S-methyltransferase